MGYNLQPGQIRNNKYPNKIRESCTYRAKHLSLDNAYKRVSMKKIMPARIGIALTVLYLTATFYFALPSFIKKITEGDISSIGSFLSGAFGPIAILWLILGFVEQRKELKLNREALRLQYEELKNSVEQQTKLAASANRANEMMHDRIETGAVASFVFEAAEEEQSNRGKLYSFKVINHGATVRSLKVVTQGAIDFRERQSSGPEVGVWEGSGVRNLVFLGITENEETISLEYISLTGRHHVEKFYLYLDSTGARARNYE